MTAKGGNRPLRAGAKRISFFAAFDLGANQSPWRFVIQRHILPGAASALIGDFPADIAALYRGLPRLYGLIVITVAHTAIGANRGSAAEGDGETDKNTASLMIVEIMQQGDIAIGIIRQRSRVGGRQGRSGDAFRG